MEEFQMDKKQHQKGSSVGHLKVDMIYKDFFLQGNEIKIVLLLAETEGDKIITRTSSGRKGIDTGELLEIRLIISEVSFVRFGSFKLLLSAAKEKERMSQVCDQEYHCASFRSIFIRLLLSLSI